MSNTTKKIKITIEIDEDVFAGATEYYSEYNEATTKKDVKAEIKGHLETYAHYNIGAEYNPIFNR
tara:strand:- start:537 stop:731 length:195 start_codon:yes stop_codon:yes gene_type:complete